jgi:LAGLIDADG DNA endonuclease family protein
MFLSSDYVAGLFDGEGWFNINRGKRKDVRRGYAFQVHAAMSLKQQPVLEAFQRLFGGTVRQQKSRSRKHATYFRWVIAGEDVAAFALAVGPMLRIKRKQAQLAVKFQTFKRRNKNAPSSDARYARLTRMWEEMKMLNKKGPRPQRVLEAA